jgi:hypothetical protein
LLNEAGNLQFVFNLFELVLGFGFAKRRLDMCCRCRFPGEQPTAARLSISL